VSPEQDDFEEDDERDEFASRSIFAAGWFRAVLVLTVLAIVVVVSLPYLLNWFEPSPPPARVATPAESPRPAPSAEAPSTLVPAPAVAPSTPAAPPPPAVATSPSAPKSAPAAPSSAPASSKSVGEKPVPPPSTAKAVVEKPPAPRAAKPTEKAAAPTRVAKVAASGGKPATAPKADGAQAGEGGGYWVQLGVFKDAGHAENLAKAVREEGFPVQVSRVSRGADGGKGMPPEHEIFVTDASVEKVTAALRGRGTAQSVPNGVVVKPSLSLQEAMTVSKQLTDEGLKVVIRPAGGSAQGTYHLVRAGGYADRARALAARDQLKGKGHEGFLTQGPAK
jgi:cell division septation protein DedD